MFFWIYNIPNTLLSILFASVFLIFTWAGLIATRGLVRRWLGPEPGRNDYVGAIMSAHGVFYGLMLGLIAVGTYENYTDVEATISKESASLGALYSDVGGFPEHESTLLQGHLRTYCEYVIKKEWPAHRRGLIPEKGAALIKEFQDVLLSIEPARKKDEILLAASLREYDSLLELRQERLEDVTSGLPAALWYIVAVGAVISIVLIWMFSIEKLSIQLVLAGLYAVFIGLMIFLIAAMDNPFRGEFSVEADPFKDIQDRLMKPTAAETTLPQLPPERIK